MPCGIWRSGLGCIARLCFVEHAWRSTLALSEAVAVAVHLKDVDVVGVIRRENRESNPSNPRSHEAKLLCGRPTNVDNSAATEGTSVIDPHNNRFVVGKIDDLDLGAKRQGPMRSRQDPRYVGFTAGSDSAR